MYRTITYFYNAQLIRGFERHGTRGCWLAGLPPPTTGRPPLYGKRTRQTPHSRRRTCCQMKSPLEIDMRGLSHFDTCLLLFHHMN